MSLILLHWCMAGSGCCSGLCCPAAIDAAALAGPTHSRTLSFAGRMPFMAQGLAHALLAVADKPQVGKGRRGGWGRSSFLKASIESCISLQLSPYRRQPRAKSTSVQQQKQTQRRQGRLQTRAGPWERCCLAWGLCRPASQGHLQLSQGRMQSRAPRSHEGLTGSGVTR